MYGSLFSVVDIRRSEAEPVTTSIHTSIPQLHKPVTRRIRLHSFHYFESQFVAAKLVLVTKLMCKEPHRSSGYKGPSWRT